MNRKSIQAVLAFLFGGFLTSLLGLIIFQIKVGIQEDKRVLAISQLKNENSPQWASSPGSTQVPINNSFQLFSVSKDSSNYWSFSLLPEQQNYTYDFSYSNLTYIPSSQGFISYVPKIEFVSQGDESKSKKIELSQINLVAIKNFYNHMHQPQMLKLPIQLDIIMNSLQQDFLVTYFSQTIIQLFTNDKTATQTAIFNIAKLDQQNQLWNDEYYGWQTDVTFRAWVRVALMDSQQSDSLYVTLSSEFELSDAQMQVLVGPYSMIKLLITSIIRSISDGIKTSQSGTCNQDVCTMQELATAQWCIGILSEKQKLVPPTILPTGGYQAYNDSIPDVFEYYKYDEQSALNFDLSKVITKRLFEEPSSMFDLTTMKLITNNITNLQRIQASFKIPPESDEPASIISDYFQKLILKTSYQETLAQETWRYLSRMFGEGANLLRNSLHAKALFYKKLDCMQLTNGFTFQSRLCQTSLDFTLDPKNGMVFVEAALQTNSQHSQAYTQLFEKLQPIQLELNQFLWGQDDGSFGQVVAEIASSLSKIFKCSKSSKCSSWELFVQQWPDSSVTLTDLSELGFKYSDEVDGIGKLDTVNTPNIHYEWGSFYIKYWPFVKFTYADAKKLLSYDLGGLMGYYSLYKLTDAIQNSIPLSPDYPFTLQDAEIVQKYLINGLLNYQYGGELLETNPIDYLWQYENDYTQNQQKLDPLTGGAAWKTNSVGLLEKINEEYVKYATYDDIYQIDSGIKNIDSVRQIVRIMDSQSIKAKQIVYLNPTSQFQSVYYVYPQGETKLKGSQGLGFTPQFTKKNIGKLWVFDQDLYQNVQLENMEYTEQFGGMDCQVFQRPNKMYDMQSFVQYPLYISQGDVEVDCIGPIGDYRCTYFLQNLNLQNKILIEQISGIVLSMDIAYIYWLNLTDSIFLECDRFKNQKGMVPLAIRRVQMSYTQENVDELLSDLQQLNSDRKIYFIVFLGLASLFLLVFIGTLIYYCKNKNNFVDEVEYQFKQQQHYRLE